LEAVYSLGQPPLKGFVVPGVVHDEDWHDTSVDSGIVFDRARLLNNIPSPFPDEELLEDIRGWIADERIEAVG
jgi:hypothetical protein